MAFNTDQYRRRSGGSLGSEALANVPEFDMDSVIEQLDSLTARRDKLEAAKKDLKKEAVVADVDMQRYGLGRVEVDENGNIKSRPFNEDEKEQYNLRQLQAAQIKAQAQAASFANIQNMLQGGAGMGLPSGVSVPGGGSAGAGTSAGAASNYEMSGFTVGGMRFDNTDPASKKKVLSAKQIASITDLINAADQYEQVVLAQEANKFKTGPLGVGSLGYQNIPGAAQARAVNFSPEEAEFFSASRSALNEYIKAQSGVARGLKEFAQLAPAVPDPAQFTPEQFGPVGMGAIQRVRQSVDDGLNLLERAGYKNVQAVREGTKKQREFTSAEEANAAIQAGQVKPGMYIRVGGKIKRVKRNK